jgi:DNA (cytosine-5)-methyltransferase 1
MIRIGSAFSGIGGFELGLERAIPNSKTVWQIEQNPFCQKILQKHWPDAKIYDDVREVGAHNLEPIDVLCAGFPCQDISVAGKGEGLDGEKSGLWWECFRLISELRPRIIVLENVAAITFRGGREVVGSLASIGYDTEWQVISARMFGAPHRRDRWFAVAYPNSLRFMEHTRQSETIQSKRNKGLQRKESKKSNMSKLIHSSNLYVANTYHGSEATKIQAGRSEYVVCDTRERSKVTNTYSERSAQQSKSSITMEQKIKSQCRSSKVEGVHQGNYWQRHVPESPVCRVDDGIPNRVDRLKALGNAIVPQCSEYIGRCIVGSGLLQVG